jgi:hypothetical protein
VGVLGILAVLAAAFVTMAQLERKASVQRLSVTKALLLARSGLEDALARLGAGQDPDAPESWYRGEDWDDDGTVSGLESASEIFKPGIPNLEDCPVHEAMRPSFYRRHSTDLDANGRPAPDLSQTVGRQRGSTGGVAGGAYSLKVLPEEGIYVNGGDLNSAGEHPGTYDAVLKRILGNLAEEIGGILVRADGEALLTGRPAGGWASLGQAAQALGWTPAKTEALEPYLAFHAWVDRKVIKPNVDPDWVPSGQTPNSWAEIRVGKRDVPAAVGAPWSGKRAFNTRTGSYAPDFERDSQGRIVGRAPVNLNWARERPPVLRALLRGLSGIYLEDHFGNHDIGPYQPDLSDYNAKEYGWLGPVVKQSLSASDIDSFVAALQAHADFPTWAADYPEWDQTPGFDSWDEFNRFLESKLYAAGPPAWRDSCGWGRSKLDLLRANFNPNSDLNKFNPGESFFKRIDKSDLASYSTEFSLAPSPVKRLSSCGRLRDAQGRVLAERTLGMTVSYGRFRMTAQSEFCAGTLGSLEEAGDEGAFRLPGDAGFLEETPSPYRTHGSRFSPTGRGFALQTYPEPQHRGTDRCPAPAACDGRLELATLETEASLAANPGLTFLASWDDGYDATQAAGSRTCTTDLGHGSPSDSLFGNGPAGGVAALNMIYPDGCYCESQRTPGYLSLDNIGDGLQGIVSLWYKSAIPYTELEVGSRDPTLLGLEVVTKPPSYAAWYEHTQFFRIEAWVAGGDLGALGCLLESRGIPGDHQIEAGHAFQKVGAYTIWENFWHPHRWVLVTCQWHLLAADAGTFSTFLMNATEAQYEYAPGGNAAPMNYGGNPADCVLSRNCYRGDGSVGPPYLYLGARGPMTFHRGPADGTLDELVFVTPPSTSMTESQTLASNRFARGRYCKEDDALDPAKPEFLSCKVPLGAGARVNRVDWTLNLPRMPIPPAADIAHPELWPDPSRIFYGTGASPTTGKTADAAVDLADAAGGSILPGRLTRPGSSVAVRPPGGVVRIGINIRPRVRENAPPWDKGNAPILESPVLDDVTLTYEAASGPRVLAWERR